MRYEFKRLARWATLAGGTAALVLGLIPGTPAMALPVMCGDTLTANTTLTADLTCAGTGLTIGAAGITVNLAGHTITGTGAAEGIVDGAPGPHFDNVTIRNGTVSGFLIDVHLQGASGVGLRNLHLAGPGLGVRAQASPGYTIVDGTFAQAGTWISDSPDGTITRSQFAGTATVSLDSDSNLTTFTGNVLTNVVVSLFEVDGTLVENNTFTGSSVVSSGSSRRGLYLRNRFSGAGVALSFSDNVLDTVVVSNTFTGNHVGLQVHSTPLGFIDGLLVRDNTFTKNSGAGALIDVVNALGPPVTADVLLNTFTGNGSAPAGLVDHLGTPVADGLHIAIPAGATFVVGGNRTKNNGAFGVYAVPGTVADAGGNTSVGNPSGCFGVVC